MKWQSDFSPKYLPFSWHFLKHDFNILHVLAPKTLDISDYLYRKWRAETIDLQGAVVQNFDIIDEI